MSAESRISSLHVLDRPLKYVVVQRSADLPFWVVLLRTEKRDSAPPILKTNDYTQWFHFKRDVEPVHPAVHHLDWGDTVIVRSYFLPRDKNKEGFWVNEKEEIETATVADEVSVGWHDRTKELRKVVKIDHDRGRITIQDGEGKFHFDRTRASVSAFHKIKEKSLACCESFRLSGTHWVSEGRRFALPSGLKAPESLKEYCRQVMQSASYWTRIYFHEKDSKLKENRSEAKAPRSKTSKKSKSTVSSKSSNSTKSPNSSKTSTPKFSWARPPSREENDGDHPEENEEIEAEFSPMTVSPDVLAEYGDLVEMDVEEDSAHEKSFGSDDARENYMDVSPPQENSDESLTRIQFVIDNSKPKNTKVQVEIGNNDREGRKVFIGSPNLPLQEENIGKLEKSGTELVNQPIVVERGDETKAKLDIRSISAAEQTEPREDNSSNVKSTLNSVPKINNVEKKDINVLVEVDSDKSKASPGSEDQSPSDKKAQKSKESPKTADTVSSEATNGTSKVQPSPEVRSSPEMSPDAANGLQKPPKSPVKGFPPPMVSNIPPGPQIREKSHKPSISAKSIPTGKSKRRPDPRLGDPRLSSVNITKIMTPDRLQKVREAQSSPEDRENENPNNRKRMRPSMFDVAPPCVAGNDHPSTCSNQPETGGDTVKRAKCTPDPPASAPVQRECPYWEIPDPEATAKLTFNYPTFDLIPPPPPPPPLPVVKEPTVEELLALISSEKPKETEENKSTSSVPAPKEVAPPQFVPDENAERLLSQFMDSVEPDAPSEPDNCQEEPQPQPQTDAPRQMIGENTLRELHKILAHLTSFKKITFTRTGICVDENGNNTATYEIEAKYDKKKR